MFLSCKTIEKLNKKYLWLLDGGCNDHMTGNKELFSSLDNYVKSEIKLGDDHPINSLGKEQSQS